MNYTDNKSKEILELKYKKMMERITRLEGIVKLIYPLDEDKNQAIQIIKTYYQEMYNKIVETGQYDKYEQVEDTILESMAKIEVEIEQYKQDTYKSIGAIVQNRLNKITDFEQYDPLEGINHQNVLEQLDKYISNNTTNLEKLLEQINQIKEMLKLYEAYIKPEEMQQIQEQISIAKFKILIRMQIGRALVGEDNPQSTLCEYDSEEERKIFEQQLEELINKNPNIQLEQPVSQIMQDSKILNKILENQIMEMALKNIDLLYAPIFNAHLCNIEPKRTDMFKKLIDVYLGDSLHKYNNYKNESHTEGSVHACILSAVIDNLITKQNIGIMDCYRIYSKFGYECCPIVLNERQKAIDGLWNFLKQTTYGKRLLQEEAMPTNGLIEGVVFPKNKKVKIAIKPRKVDFEEEKRKYTEFGSKKLDLPFITDDELIKRLIETDANTKGENTDGFILPEYKTEIDEEKKRELIAQLEQMQQKEGNQTLEETIERLKLRYDALEFIGETPNKWIMLPLGSALEKVPTPEIRLRYLNTVKKASNQALCDHTYGISYNTEGIRYYNTAEIFYKIEGLLKKYIIIGDGLIEKPENVEDCYCCPEGFIPPIGGETDELTPLPHFFSFDVYISLSKIADLPLDLDRIRCSKQQEAR